MDSYDIDFTHFLIDDFDIMVENQLLSLGLNSLNKTERAIIPSSFFLGISDSTIANNMNVARGTVYYHRMRASKRLKQFMEENNYDKSTN